MIHFWELVGQIGRLPPLEQLLVTPDLMLSEDQDDITKVLQGDQAAYAALVGRHQRRLLGLLFHACGSRDEAEDLAQETFARAYRKLHLYEGRSSFYTWLCRVAMNLLISQRRRKSMENQNQREGFEVALNTVGDEHSAEQQVAREELRQCVQAAIALLDHERRAVILLRDFDGMDYEQIAETLEIPVGTVRSRLHRARLELKSILEQRVGQLGQLVVK
ncbi:MAG: sigma-70 family RNA polymerase sigma factor [Pirellulaceae bacterium]|nr:sigma-70 family RNA polymerase sigma factor [Pirellulaceae bacterium]